MPIGWDANSTESNEELRKSLHLCTKYQHKHAQGSLHTVCSHKMSVFTPNKVDDRLMFLFCRHTGCLMECCALIVCRNSRSSLHASDEHMICEDPTRAGMRSLCACYKRLGLFRQSSIVCMGCLN